MAFGRNGADKMTELRDILVSLDDDNDNVNDIESEISNNLDSFEYDGNALINSYIGLALLSDDWDILGMMEVNDQGNQLVDWIFGEEAPSTDWRFGCNEDIMQHSGKGVLGIRMDGVNDVTLTGNIIISQLHEKTGLGTLGCGDYEGPVSEGEGGQVKQKTPMQVGFSGNNVQAISITTSTNVVFDDNANVEISNIKSDFGEVFGVSFWTANDISIDENALIKVWNVESGAELESNLIGYDSRPNRSPESCGVRLETDDSNEVYESEISVSNDDNILVCNVKGHEYCLGSEENGLTMFGNYLSDDSSVCQEISNLEGWKRYSNVNIQNIHNNIGFRFDKDGIVFLLGSLVAFSFFGVIWRVGTRSKWSGFGKAISKYSLVKQTSIDVIGNERVGEGYGSI